MSRRRKGNKLLGRIFAISVIVHIIAIPILAKVGAFEKIKEHFMTATVIVPPPEPEEKPQTVAKKETPKKSTATVKKSANSAPKAARNLPQPNVVASNAKTDSGAGDDSVVDPNGNGRVGVPPTVSGNGNGTGASTDTETKPETKPDPKPETKPETKSDPKAETKADPKPDPKPHVPVFATAEATYQPQPEIPDDLRYDALDKTVTIEISVLPDGTVGEAKVVDSCGVDELDGIALRTAKKWKFRPATKDGDPIGSRMRLHIQFKVEG